MKHGMFLGFLDGFFHAGGFAVPIFKGIIVALGWFFLPLWVFFALSLYLFFIPSFQSFKFLRSFSLFLLCAALFPVGIVEALFLGAIFFLLLGMKELVFIERNTAYEAFFFLFTFIVFFEMFRAFPGWETAGSWTWLLVGTSFFFLGQEFVKHSFHLGGGTDSRSVLRSSTAFAFLSLCIWQGGVVLSFLPANFFYQTTILFAGIAALFEALLDYTKGEFTENRAFVYLSFFFVVFVVTLSAIPWGI